MSIKHLKVAFVLFFLLSNFLIVGCAATPISTDLAQNVPSERVLKASLLKERPGYGQVIVKKDPGLMFSECNTRVFVNTVAAAEIAPGEKVVLYLPEGEQMIAAEPTYSICTGGLIEVMVNVSRSRPAVLRVSFGGRGAFLLQPTAY